ncbi:MAG: bifunctional DNA-formamidopyrimidine glycosylase/DNA-(apurinic or apyrimidinic site) lyase [Gammaproteobacteria bacterium]|nr:bifunctional DNA-formamidopyrimidine glycosylase/DNA-(apurinic or apyrimidinic site) lyase [Gammaproteobacteria bacterium]
MPELPEVTTTINGIRPYFQGAVIAGMAIRERRLRWPIRADLEQRLQGRKVIDIQRRAKYIVVILDRGGLLMHLGMTGSFRVVTSQSRPEKHDHFDFITDAGAVIRYRDPRRFGSLIYCEEDPYRHERLSKFGVEPLELDFTGAYLHRMSRTRKLAVKAFIMDQSVVVGVGNIYASESLFMAGIHPRRKCSRISISRYNKLAGEIQSVLTKSINMGGTTIQDFVGTDGRPGYFEQQLLVYGRCGEPCRHCGRTITTRVIAQRSSFFCPQCQT